ncbi:MULTISPECIES: hypothetical protein [unclassified Sphingomonas]|uniref:hypothetical protein n=1 Tax=unclassified Sphingomonas TaxID=196159 RepID=UPI0006FDCF16|nr:MULTISPECIES: hypothetical protein [unclassified Sphingomonas]KQM56960.1 hypothetical protein ASE65_13945 [Sphingomonas sp. Leaf16]KQN09332.1 hypothetical protein ASE81_13990 [Sphingomonas sp. Leaf29]KQN17510.1 hypothetical protein ASE83_13925 [Sphingomonas sp. Leaf32]
MLTNPDTAPLLVALVLIGVAAWVFTTWLRVKNGYPLQGGWGQSVYPQRNDETVERVKLLSQENAQLKAELGSIKDRLANVERIVTDGAHSLDREIEQLRGRAN